jgi:hypothetical protein
MTFIYYIAPSFVSFVRSVNNAPLFIRLKRQGIIGYDFLCVLLLKAFCNRIENTKKTQISTDCIAPKPTSVHLLNGELRSEWIGALTPFIRFWVLSAMPTEGFSMGNPKGVYGFRCQTLSNITLHILNIYRQAQRLFDVVKKDNSIVLTA